MISLYIVGDPKSQPRPRLGRHGVYNPRTAQAWKAAIMDAVKRHCQEKPYDCPIIVNCTWYFKAPRRLKDALVRTPHLAKPDRDNLDKVVLDALTKVGFVKDDSRIWSGTITKMYALRGQPPGMRLEITVGKNIDTEMI